jgi:hypothetical protein
MSLNAPTSTANTTIFFATRYSANNYIYPNLRVADISFSDAPQMWATDELADSIYNQGSIEHPKSITASAAVTVAPYTRAIRITIAEAFSFDASAELSIIAASEVRQEVQKAMTTDALAVLNEAEKSGCTVTHDIDSDSRDGVIIMQRAFLHVQQTGKYTSWEIWHCSVDAEGAEVANRRVVTQEEEEDQRTNLGIERMPRCSGEGRTMGVRPSWEDMGLVRVEEDKTTIVGEELLKEEKDGARKERLQSWEVMEVEDAKLDPNIGRNMEL